MNVRTLALDIIDSVYKNKSFSNIELNKALRENTLSNLDKNLLTILVYGTLQKSTILDYEISKVVERNNYKPKVRTLLKMSLFQLRYLSKIPAYAIINESVEISKDQFGFQTSKFVNAVLRKLSQESFLPKLEEMDELEYYSLMSSFPLWASKMIEKQYGREVILNYLKTIGTPTKLFLRVNTLRTTKEEMLKKEYFEEGNLVNSIVYKGEKSISELDEFLKGFVTVQSESSQEVSLFLNPSENDSILDMCAAPGSKTYHIADLFKNNGQITSCDLYPHRIDLLKNNLPRLNIKCVKTKVYDSTKISEVFKEESFDKVLLDAPCSGLGVIRRKPDILLSLSMDKLDGIIALQQSLIDEAIKMVKDGGYLVYSTCTLNKKENELQTKYILDKYPFMKLVEDKLITPSTDHYDGFYMAKFKKEK